MPLTSTRAIAQISRARGRSGEPFNATRVLDFRDKLNGLEERPPRSDRVFGQSDRTPEHERTSTFTTLPTTRISARFYTRALRKAGLK